MRGFAVALTTMGLAGCASAPDEAPAPTEVEVTMVCTVIERGGLSNCRVIREKPGGYGMAAEAILSAEQGRASVQPVGGGPRATGVGDRTEVSMVIPLDAAAFARFRRIRTEVSEPATDQ
ncbi:hypothetical protein [Brevundimonas sp. NIBR11]|uniref:hypothetical protein n=1 Tax=Brevundimonas sp. NIBR11 TaxID=3015999 RepID=UPI0022F07E58|nr:hypothetical protein [Brevundimonas sp. NIBR11]WGM31703.1 hypothetical protein KKHFBJBL_01951 [Brevundimonas sp. NIBR11]